MMTIVLLLGLLLAHVTSLPPLLFSSLKGKFSVSEFAAMILRRTYVRRSACCWIPRCAFVVGKREHLHRLPRAVVLPAKISVVLYPPGV